MVDRFSKWKNYTDELRKSPIFNAGRQSRQDFFSTVPILFTTTSTTEHEVKTWFSLPLGVKAFIPSAVIFDEKRRITAAESSPTETRAAGFEALLMIVYAVL
jgi:hypothetical protein